MFSYRVGMVNFTELIVISNNGFFSQDKQFVPIVNTEQLIIHYAYDGNLIPVDSDEAKLYLQKEYHRLYRMQISCQKVQSNTLFADDAPTLPITLPKMDKNEESVKAESKVSDENVECK